MKLIAIILWKPSIMIKLAKLQELILPAAIAAICSMIIYFVGFHDTKKQSFYEHKLSAMEKYVKDASSRIYYMRFMDWIHLNIAKAQVKDLPEPNTTEPFEAILYYSASKYNSKYISDDKTDLIKAELKKKDSVRYKGFEQANETYSQYEASYLTTMNFFDDDTNNEIKKLDSLLNPACYEKIVKAITHYGGLSNVVNGTIDRVLLGRRYAQLNIVVDAMEKEIEKGK